MVSWRHFVRDVSSSNFGLLIGFLLPGFTVLWGLSYFSETVSHWLIGSSTTATVGGFMYVTLASVAAGVTVSTVRWAVIDTIHRWTGLRQPEWDFSRLQDNVAAYNVLNEIHYKFYLFHSNHLVALLVVYLARRIHLGFFTAPCGWFDVGFLVLSVALFVGSRDTLKKYFTRGSQLFGPPPTRSGADPSTPSDSTQPPILSSAAKTRIVHHRSNQPVSPRHGGRHAPESENGSTCNRQTRIDQGDAQKAAGSSEGTQEVTRIRREQATGNTDRTGRRSFPIS